MDKIAEDDPTEERHDSNHTSSASMTTSVVCVPQGQKESALEEVTAVLGLPSCDAQDDNNHPSKAMLTSEGLGREVGDGKTIGLPIVSPVKASMRPAVVPVKASADPAREVTQDTKGPASEEKQAPFEEQAAVFGPCHDAHKKTCHKTYLHKMVWPDQDPFGKSLEDREQSCGISIPKELPYEGTDEAPEGQKGSALEDLTALVGESCGDTKDNNCPTSAVPMTDKPIEEHLDTASSEGTIGTSSVVFRNKPTMPPVVSPSKAPESSVSEKKQGHFEELAPVFGPRRRHTLHLHQFIWPDDTTGDAKQVPYEATPVHEVNSKITTAPMLNEVNDPPPVQEMESQIDPAMALERASKAKRNYEWLKHYNFSELGTPFFEEWWGKQVWLDVWDILRKQLKKLPDTDPPLHEGDWFTLAKGLKLYRRSQVSDAETQALVHQADMDEHMPTQYFMQQLDPNQEILTFKRNPKAHPKPIPFPPGSKREASASWDESSDGLPELVGGPACASKNPEVQCIGVTGGVFGCGTYVELTVRSQSHFEQTYAGEDDPALLTDNPGLELALRGEFVGPVYVHSPHELRCIQQANLYRPPYLKIIWFKSDQWKENEYSKAPSDEIKPQEYKRPQRSVAASGSLQGCVSAPVQEFFDNLVSKAVQEAINKDSDSTDTMKPGNEETVVAPQDDAISKEYCVSAKKPCLEKVMVADRGKLIGIRQDQVAETVRAVDGATAGIGADKGLQGQLQYMTRLLEGSHYIVDQNVWRQILRIYNRSIEKAHIPMECGPRLTQSLKETWCNILRSVPKNDKPRFRLYLHDFMFHILSHLHDKDTSVPGTTPFGPVHTATAAKRPEDNDKKPAWNPKLKKRKYNESSND